MSWDEIFKIIAPRMCGYILKRGKDGYNEREKYLFEDDLGEHLGSKIIQHVQRRKINFGLNQIDTIIVQLNELSLVAFAEKKEKDDTVFRDVTLTETGERQFTILSTERRVG